MKIIVLKNLIPFIGILLFHTDASAAIHTETVEYKQNGIVLEGYLAYDDSVKEKVPGVCVVPAQTGRWFFTVTLCIVSLIQVLAVILQRGCLQ